MSIWCILHHRHTGVGFCLFVFGLTRASVQISIGSTLSLLFFGERGTYPILKNHMKIRHLFFAALAIGLLSASCGKIPENGLEQPGTPEAQEVKVYFTYSLDTSVGSEMTKANSDIFKEFYNKILSTDLVAPDYDLTLTEVNTGAKYQFVGSWAGHNMVTVRTGKYKLTGTSTAQGKNLQDKCSLFFDEEIQIDATSGAISLAAKYDCFLLIFNKLSIATLQNTDGEAVEDFFDFGSYKYAFVNGALFSEANKETAHILGKYTDNAYFKIFTGKLTFEKGKYYVYNSIAGGFNIPEMEEGEPSGGTLNLSAAGTANCYLVPTLGNFSFDASVKGNGTQSVGEIASVDVLWETFNTNDTPGKGDVIQEVSINNGIVSFSTSGKQGNALIAVKNSEGIILWSWHIWVTDYNPEQDFNTFKGFENLKVMDRNLGALSKEPGVNSFGMVYQWGRKDPFLGKDPGTGSTFSATAMNTSVTTSAEYGTESYAIQNPLVFIKAKSQGGDWRNNSDNTLWGSTKTINDPCPLGWRVPDGGENGLFSNLSLNDGTFDRTKYGRTFGDIWLPAQGYLSDSGFSWWQCGVEGRYWTITAVDATHADHMSFNSSELFVTRSSPTHCSRANGIAVRCVKE